MKALLNYASGPYLPDCDTSRRSSEKAELLPARIPAELMRRLPSTLCFHTHNFIEITQVMDAGALYFADRQLIRMNPGDLIVFNRFVPHAWYLPHAGVKLRDYSFLPDAPDACQPSPCDGMNLTIAYTAVSCGSAAQDLRHIERLTIRKNFIGQFARSEFRCARISCEAPIHGTLCSLLRDIDRECEKKQTAYEDIVQSKLTEFIACLYRYLSEPETPVKSGPGGGLSAALRYMEENLQAPLRLDEIAAVCYMTPPYFSAFFKKQMGINFSYYLNRLRVGRAYEQIVGSDEPVLTIARQCGFRSKSSFYRAWYEAYGVNPSCLRKSR